ncbi:Hpt domain-containing protein [Sphingobacterium spiritivorum]|nr:Hpt domain-containing protein [Sphingobacterium spiritivorum]WQD35084.1 Hpt domain-containing protein [Sphingobacterium spiritivorum]SUI99340.1 Hpt domain [Sphingobacterium spiritivorum]
MYNLIDPSLISSTMMDNSDIIREFITLYVAQTPVDEEALRTAIRNNNLNEIASKAHHIKPTMEYIGAFALKDRIITIESLAKEQADINLIKDEFAILEKQLQDLYQELQHYLNSLR